MKKIVTLHPKSPNFKVKNRVKNILAIIVASLFMSYYASVTMFVHTHFFEWGTITHSHPASNGHSHSSDSYRLISHLSNFAAVITAAVAILAIGYTLYSRTTTETVSVFFAKVRLYSLRAPPVVG